MFRKQKNVRKARPKEGGGRGGKFEALESRVSLSHSGAVVNTNMIIAADSSGSSDILGYTPAQIRAAYGITGDGAGQTIAIIDAYNDPDIASDLQTFDAQFGLNNPNLSVVSQSGGSVSSIATN